MHAGYCKTFEEYASLLWKADICPITSIQDFFGISIAEAVYCNTYPLLPNRLTYPEIYNKQINEHLFYNDKKDLINKVEILIKNKEIDSENIPRNLIERFDWSYMIEEYDSLLNDFIY